MWISDDDGPFFDLVVESIAPTGVARPLTTVTDIHPAGWTTASPRLDGAVLASPQGWLVISVERDGGGIPDLERTLLIDLRAEHPQLELAGVAERAAWGPQGHLAILGSRPLLVDPITGVKTEVAVPADVDVLEAWAADASGLVAIEDMGEPSQRAGVLRGDGIFVPGVRPPYSATGRERHTGAIGQVLTVAVSDGADGAETAIVDSGPGVCPRCIVWARFKTPGDDPRFFAYNWDAAGAGLWITWQTSDRKRAWLGHMSTPGHDDPVVNLPPSVDFGIAGVSPTDAWFILDASDLRQLVLADTLTGQTRAIAKPLVPGGPAPIFAGLSSPSG